MKKGDKNKPLPPGKHSIKGVGENQPSKFEPLDKKIEVPLGKPIKHPDYSESQQDQWLLKYNEFTVFESNQINMKYLVQFEFEQDIYWYKIKSIFGIDLIQITEIIDID